MGSPSPLPASLGQDRTRRLRTAGAGQATEHPTGPAGQLVAPGAVAPAWRGVAALPARSGARARQAARRVLRRTFEIAGGRPLIERLNAFQAELSFLRDQLSAIHAGWVDAELTRASGNRGLREVERDAESTRVNLELLKGEVRELQHTLEQLGMAFAPATGLAGAGARFAELREAVNGLERRLRGQPSSQPPSQQSPLTSQRLPARRAAGPGTRAEDRTKATAAQFQTSTLFNYVGFERRFRGDPELINAILLDRYGDLLTEHQPVVDVGCGRAELCESLAARGIDVVGVEPDPGMAAEARSRGVTVHEALAGEYLRSVPAGSLGSVITTHVVEHLPLDALIEMLEGSARALRPGGVFVGETPNPAALIVLGNSYILDPTHVMPLHPSLLAFLCESAGFRDVRLRFYSPATDYHLPQVAVPGGAATWAAALAGEVNAGFDRLNEVLFGPQEYAVVARTPP
ncbi:MAG TPA: class I SAM-dependent methyltransferase [Mycobacteriales bacterium]|nr:class I SAM-dependent methyltransferase [Mycobacteriales bacterium]